MYDTNWFRSRAKDSLKRISEDTWDFSDSLFSYLPGRSEDNYIDMQSGGRAYFDLITTQERKHLQEVAPQLNEHLPDYFDYIDLGPGSDNKAGLIVNNLNLSGKEFDYIPVDISKKYISQIDYSNFDQCMAIKSLNLPFEETARALKEISANFRLVYLGFTYPNYGPGSIINLLRDIIAGNGCALITTQIREEVDISHTEQTYLQTISVMLDEKIRLLGLEPKSVEYYSNNKVEVWATITESGGQFNFFKPRKGDKIKLFQSLRPTKSGFINDLKKHTNKYYLLESETSFVSALIN